MEDTAGTAQSAGQTRASTVAGQAGQSGNAGIDLESTDNAPTPSSRPTALRSTSSTTSSAPSANSETEKKHAIEGLVWNGGERVKYDTEGNIRGRKQGQRQGKAKRKQETEVR